MLDFNLLIYTCFRDWIFYFMYCIVCLFFFVIYLLTIWQIWNLTHSNFVLCKSSFVFPVDTLHLLSFPKIFIFFLSSGFRSHLCFVSSSFNSLFNSCNLDHLSFFFMRTKRYNFTSHACFQCVPNNFGTYFPIKLFLQLIL